MDKFALDALVAFLSLLLSSQMGGHGLLLEHMPACLYI